MITFCFQCLQKPHLATDTKDKEYKPHDIPQRQSVPPLETCPPARRAKRMRAEVSLRHPCLTNPRAWSPASLPGRLCVHSSFPGECFRGGESESWLWAVLPHRQALHWWQQGPEEQVSVRVLCGLPGAVRK